MNRIKVFLKDPNKKSVLKMIKEVVILMVKKKEIPFYYFKYLYRKNVTNYLDYLSLNEQRSLQLHESLHNPEYDSLLSNKLYFSLLSEKNAIKTPRLLSYNLKSSFFYNNKAVQIFNKEALIDFFEEILENSIDGVFFRPPSDYGGKSCFKITRVNLKSALNDKYEILTSGDFVHTEVIKQHKMINQIHSNSINTLRMVTLITSDNRTEIISAFMRFGIGDSVVDNASSGGFFVGINLEDGTLKSKGYFKPEFGGKVIIKHPDSDFIFEGFKVPYYKEACESVIDGVKVIPDRLIGWDVAISLDGPVIIETNTKASIHTSDIAYGGLLKNQHVKKLIAELKQ